MTVDVAQSWWTAVTDHPYALLGPLVLVEGPAATVLGGSLVGAGLALFWPVLAIVIGADVLADSALYLLGRLGNRPRPARLLRRLGLGEHRRARLTAALHGNLPRTVASAKLVDIAAVPTFLAAGLARIPYRRFAGWVAATSAVRAVVLLGLGVLFGRQAAGLLHTPGAALGLAVLLGLLAGAVHLIVRRCAGRFRTDP